MDLALDLRRAIIANVIGAEIWAHPHFPCCYETPGIVQSSIASWVTEYHDYDHTGSEEDYWGNRNRAGVIWPIQIGIHAPSRAIPESLVSYRVPGLARAEFLDVIHLLLVVNDVRTKTLDTM
jgi:hypothetical protein